MNPIKKINNGWKTKTNESAKQILRLRQKGKGNKTIAKTLSVSKNTEVMLPIIRVYPPPAYKAEYLKINFCTRLPAPYPNFTFFCNLPQYVKDPYKRFIENKQRENFNFTGFRLLFILERSKQLFRKLFLLLKSRKGIPKEDE